MKKQKPQEPKYDAFPSPAKLGAKPCPNCDTDTHTTLSSKTLGSRAVFVEITCSKCFRTAISEVEMSIGPGIRSAVKRWNSSWPDVAYYLDGPSEGRRE